LGELPRRLAAGQSSANHVYELFHRVKTADVAFHRAKVIVPGLPAGVNGQ